MPTATYTTYDIVGKKEEVDDIISNLTPTTTPFTSSIGKDKVSEVLFQWQEDDIRAPQANAQPEGFEAVDVARTPTRMRQNVTQILSDTFKTSGTADAIKSYGRAKESAYQLVKAGKALRRDLEYAAIGTKQTLVNVDEDTARKFAGVQAQIDAGNIFYTGGTDTALTEDNLLDALQHMFEITDTPNIVMVTPADSRVIADFANAVGRQRVIENDGDPTKVINKVDLYVSPFGEVSVQLNRYLAPGDTLIYSKEYWQLVSLRPWFREVLAKTGDSMRNMLVGEYSLKHRNYQASALIRRDVAPGG